MLYIAVDAQPLRMAGEDIIYGCGELYA
jgi:hypothetical protein